MTPMQAILTKVPANENTSTERKITHDLVMCFSDFLSKNAPKDTPSLEYVSYLSKAFYSMHRYMRDALSEPLLNNVSAEDYAVLHALAIEQAIKDEYPEFYQ